MSRNKKECDDVIKKIVKDHDIELLFTNYRGLIRTSILKTLYKMNISFTEMDVEDIESEVYSSFMKNNFRRLNNFDSKRGSFANYLFIIVRSSTIDNIRKVYCNLNIEYKDDYSSNIDNNREIEYKINREKILSSKLLTKKEKKVIELYSLGKSISYVMDKTNSSKNSIYSINKRIKKKFNEKNDLTNFLMVLN